MTARRRCDHRTQQPALPDGNICASIIAAGGKSRAVEENRLVGRELVSPPLSLHHLLPTAGF